MKFLILDSRENIFHAPDQIIFLLKPLEDRSAPRRS